MNTLKLIFLLTFLCSLSNIKAQPNLPKNVADSLWGIWQNEKENDEIRLEAFRKYIWNGYLFTNQDTALYLAEIKYKFAKERNLKKEMANALNIQGISCSIKGDYEKAINFYEDCLVLRNEISDKKGSSSILSNIGLIYYELGLYNKALNFQLECLKIKKEIDDKNGLYITINNLGNIYLGKGEFDLALTYYKKNEEISIELKNVINHSKTLNNIGNVYFNKGEYAKALVYYEKSLKLNSELNDLSGKANLLNNIGLIYFKQGNNEDAELYFNNSLKIQREIGDKKGIAMTLSNLTLVLIKKKQFHLLDDYFAEIETLYKEIGSLTGFSILYNNLGLAYKDQGYYDLAIEYYSKSYEIEKEMDDKSGYISSRASIGYIMLLKNELENSIDLIEYAYEEAEKFNLPSEKLMISKFLYQSYIKINDRESSLKYLSIMKNGLYDQINSIFFTLTEREKELYFETLEENFGRYFDFTNHYHSFTPELADTAFNISLTTKGLTLKSSTAMRNSILESEDSVLINEYNNWLDIKRKLVDFNQSDEKFQNLKEELKSIEKSLVEKSNLFNDFEKINNLDWKQVQNSLKDNEAAIEFIHFRSEIDSTNPILYIALLIKKESKHPEVIQLCSEKELEEILGVFQGNNLNFVNKVYGTKKKAETALYNKIWAPIEKHLEGIQNIYYSPSGLLHKVSFAALSKGNNVYLCDSYQLNQQSSTGKITNPYTSEFKNEYTFMMLGGLNYNTSNTKKEIWQYLPGTLEETKNISTLLNKKKINVELFLENNASEENFKKKVSDANILHIATHGFFYPDPEKVKEELKKDIDESEKDILFRGNSNYANWSFVSNKNPLMRSGLVLANANDVWERDPLAEGEDGILTAQEVSNLDLRNTKLVVLSACETGLGDIKGSEGVYGLQRAFKMAGVEYIIMSLWQVPDKETSEFMTYFYTQLLKVKDIRLAFANTQKYMRKKYDPYYWGAFILTE